MGFVSGQHLLLLVLLLVVVLIIFGPGKLPDVGSGLGRAIREFRKASSDVKEQVASSMKDEPKESTPAARSEAERPSTFPELKRDAGPVADGDGEPRKVKIGG